jgi:glycerophosphoryl diester phosphodiesterase
MAGNKTPGLNVERLEERLVTSHTLIVGHRGHVAAPENTLAALRQGFDDGADVVEVDVQLTVDGIPVLMHDDTVDRTTDGTGRVADLTLAEIKSLDAGSWKGPPFAGERVPTLAEALDAAQGRGLLYLDLKDNWMGASVQRVLDEAGFSRQLVWVAVDQDEQVRDVRQHLPDTSILWWGPIPKRGSDEYFQQMRQQGVTGFDLNWWRTPRAFFKKALANGMFVSAYTLNSKSSFRQAFKLDLDAIETDNPGKLQAFANAVSGRVMAHVTERDTAARTVRANVQISSETVTEPGMQVSRFHAESRPDSSVPAAQNTSPSITPLDPPDQVHLVDSVLDEFSTP